MGSFPLSVPFFSGLAALPPTHVQSLVGVFLGAHFLPRVQVIFCSTRPSGQNDSFPLLFHSAVKAGCCSQSGKNSLQLHHLSCFPSRELRAHRLGLAAASQYFERMFNSGLEESKSGVVELADVSADTMELILRAVYTQVSGLLTSKMNPKEPNV